MLKTAKTPRILYVTPCWAYKGVSGAHIRSLNLLRALQQVGAVEVMVLGNDPTKREQDSHGDIGPEVVHSIELQPKPNKRLVDKLRWTFDPRSNYPEGFGVVDEAMRLVLGGPEKFDLIWFFKSRSADVFPNSAWPRSVLDIDDIPSSYERSRLQSAEGVVDRLLTLRRLFVSWRRDKLLGGRFNVLTVCSEEDKEYLTRMGLKVPIHIIPNGFELPAAETIRALAIPPRIGFIAGFEYLPNREGVNWFVNQCWPRVKRAVPDARLRLVGPGSDGPFMSVGPDIDGLGWIENPSDEMKTWSQMIVPIRTGGGTRIKIAQAFSQKCPVVSTSLGAHGYRVTDGNEMYLADSAGAFADACIKTIQEPAKAAQMAGRAWSQYLEKWTWESIRPRVWAAAEDCLRLNGCEFPPISGMPRSTNRFSEIEIAE